MENNIVNIWKQSNKAIPFSILKSFINEMRILKPHLLIQSFQFIKAMLHDLLFHQDYDNLQPYKQMDEHDDLFNTYFDKNGSAEIVTQVDLINWVYFQVFDEQLGVQKTLKVSFLELIDSSTMYLQKEIMSYKHKITSNEKRRDLLLRIYDYYFISISDESGPLYFVIEQELVHSAVSKKNSTHFNNSQESIEQHKQQCLIRFQNYMEFDSIDLQTLSLFARYYLSQNRDGTFSIKLSPIDFYPLFDKQNISSTIKKVKNLIRSNDDDYSYREDECNNNCDDNPESRRIDCKIIKSKQVISNEQERKYKIQLNQHDKVEDRSSFIKYLQSDHPQLWKLHDQQILIIASQNPFFTNIELSSYSQTFIQFRGKSCGKPYFLTYIRYESHSEAERIYKQYQMMQNLQLFHQDSSCEILPIQGSNTYLLFVELDFQEFKPESVNNMNYVISPYIYSKVEILFCWLIEKLEKALQVEEICPIQFYFQIIDIGSSDEMGTPDFYFKDMFTFQHKYPGQSQYGINSKNILYNILRKMTPMHLGNSKFSKEFHDYFTDHSLGNKQRKSIREFPNLFKGYKSILQKIEIQTLAGTNVSLCDILQDTFELYLCDLPLSPGCNLIQVLNEYEVQINCGVDRLDQILSLLQLPTSVKFLRCQVGEEKIPESLSNFNTVFQNLKKLDISGPVHKVFETIHALDLDFEKLSQLEEISCQAFQDSQVNLDSKFQRNFFEIFKKKQFKKINVSFSTLLPQFKELNSKLLENNLTQQGTMIDQQQVMGLEENLMSVYEILSEQSSKSLQDQISQILKQYPQILIEVTQKEEQQERDSNIIVINFALERNGEKVSLLNQYLTINSNFKDYTERICFGDKFKRMTSKCYIKAQEKQQNLFELIGECIAYSQYTTNMKDQLEYEDFSDCEHCDSNKYVMRLFLSQVNLLVLDINLNWCEQTIQLMNENNNYLELKNNKFHQLTQINVHFPNNTMTHAALQGLQNNLCVCWNLYYLFIQCGEQNLVLLKQKMIQFLKIPSLSRFIFMNRFNGWDSFRY